MSRRRTVLVVGASGATGRRVVVQLLAWGHSVRALVRHPDRLPDALRGHGGLTLVEGSPLGMSEDALGRAVDGCDAVICCLGHRVSLRGIFGPPYRLVTRSVERLCQAIRASGVSRPVAFVLLGSAGVHAPDADAPLSRPERMALGLLRALLPPQADNEQAAEYLRDRVGEDDLAIEWVVVRPDSLAPGTGVSGYAVHASPKRSALFDPGRTLRSNVAHFMVRLACEASLRETWRYRMPVIYNDAEPGRA